MFGVPPHNMERSFLSKAPEPTFAPKAEAEYLVPEGLAQFLPLGVPSGLRRDFFQLLAMMHSAAVTRHVLDLSPG